MVYAHIILYNTGYRRIILVSQYNKLKICSCWRITAVQNECYFTPNSERKQGFTYFMTLAVFQFSVSRTLTPCGPIVTAICKQRGKRNEVNFIAFTLTVSLYLCCGIYNTLLGYCRVNLQWLWHLLEHRSRPALIVKVSVLLAVFTLLVPVSSSQCRRSAGTVRRARVYNRGLKAVPLRGMTKYRKGPTKDRKGALHWTTEDRQSWENCHTCNNFV